MPVRLQIPRQLYEEMVNHAREELPNECCGLFAGKSLAGERVVRVERGYRLVNALASPVTYESEPRSMFEAVRDMRRHGIDVVAVYHSHPTSAPIPSRTDLARNYSEDVMNLIVSLQGGEAVVRGWWLTAESYTEGEWEVVD